MTTVSQRIVRNSGRSRRPPLEGRPPCRPRPARRRALQAWAIDNDVVHAEIAARFRGVIILIALTLLVSWDILCDDDRLAADRP